MDKFFITSLTAPELREMFKEEIAKYFRDNPMKVKVKSLENHERLTRKDICKEYKISLGTIHNLMKRKELLYDKVGRKTLFKREDVERCINRKRGEL